MIEKIFEEGLLNYNELLMKHYQKLNLNSDEVVVLMQLLSLAQKKRFNLSTITLARLTTLKTQEAGEIVNSLFEKNCISIYLEKRSDKKLSEVFSLKPFFDKITEIFENEIKKQKEAQSSTDTEYVIKTLERAFSKSLSPSNLEIVRQWFIDDFSRQQIDQAIEITLERRRKTVNYVDRILRSESFDQDSTIDEKTAEILRKLVGK
ncbi:MAG: DnaD domain protein [Acholeplasmataceae bacterium]|jgi:DnaD/phage-associated family protein|nr:DnaD domain protein [Acholeplasmataceae bacterium]